MAPSNPIMGFVVYDFLPGGTQEATLGQGLLHCMNRTALKLRDMVRNVRRDALGKMPPLCSAPGSRSAHASCLDVMPPSRQINAHQGVSSSVRSSRGDLHHRHILERPRPKPPLP